MEAKAPLDCANKVWLHSELSAFVELICIDDNVSTRILPSVYLHRPGCQRPPRANQRQGHNKGKLGKDHPAIKFLAGLSHRVRTFEEYLYGLKTVHGSSNK
jgi:hypothetical protein